MNWAPELMRVEMDFRVERAVSGARFAERLAQQRAARAGRPSWWRRRGYPQAGRNQSGSVG
jgi:hypothetical protein